MSSKSSKIFWFWFVMSPIGYRHVRFWNDTQIRMQPKLSRDSQIRNSNHRKQNGKDPPTRTPQEPHTQWLSTHFPLTIRMWRCACFACDHGKCLVKFKSSQKGSGFPFLDTSCFTLRTSFYYVPLARSAHFVRDRASSTPLKLVGGSAPEPPAYFSRGVFA